MTKTAGKTFTTNISGIILNPVNSERKVRDTISGHFLCHRNSDLASLKEKASLSVDFVYLWNVLKVSSIKCLSEENLAYSEGCFDTNQL